MPDSDQYIARNPYTAAAEFNGVRPDLEGMDDRDLHELIERAHQIELLTHHPGWHFYVDYLSSLTMHLQTVVLSGRCTDIEDYRKKTGVVEGMRIAMDAPKNLLARVADRQAIREMKG